MRELPHKSRDDIVRSLFFFKQVYGYGQLLIFLDNFYNGVLFTGVCVT